MRYLLITKNRDIKSFQRLPRKVEASDMIIDISRFTMKEKPFKTEIMNKVVQLDEILSSSLVSTSVKKVS